MGPEYLVIAVAATAVSTFAKQLAAMAHALRKSKPAEAAPTGTKDQQVEVRLRLADGTFLVAAEGQVGDATVKRIIEEMDQG